MKTRDLIIFGGTVYTLDSAAPMVEAVWIRDGRIEAVGSNSLIGSVAPSSAERLDLHGATAFPGFTDGHTHFGMYALQKQGVEFTGASSIAEARARIKAWTKTVESGSWITGYGWDANIWPEGRTPDKTDLDDLLPDTPAAFWSKDVHALWVNSAALLEAGITTDTPDPSGGRIERDAHGAPAGILRENAADLVIRRIPRPDPEQLARFIESAAVDAHKLGITSIHCHGDKDDFRAFQLLEKQGRLRLRTCISLPYAALNSAVALGAQTGLGNEWLRVGPVKLFADGALGSRTASMIEPYEEDRGNTGIAVMSLQEMVDAVRRAADAGMSTAIHAIGDRANRNATEAFSVNRDCAIRNALRQRIEHVQLLHPDDIGKLAEAQIIASVQPVHCTADMDIADRYWGERCRCAYAFRSLIDSGVILVFGSDCPVETMDPLAGIYAAVTRRRPDGTPAGGWRPAERITRWEAIRAYSPNAAYASGEEDRKGSLTPGKIADITVLSQDITKCPEEQILQTRVVHTILDGNIVYSIEEKEKWIY
jgi:predicted amidohydrolase YtcJ